MIFVKCKEGLWCRARVVEVKQNGCAEALKACPVEQLASVTVFFLDHGLTISISMQRYAHNEQKVDDRSHFVMTHLMTTRSSSSASFTLL